MYLYLLMLPLFMPGILHAACLSASTDLQKILDRGGDLILCPETVYEIGGDSLRMTRHGQAVYTEGAVRLSGYAVLRSTDPDQHTILNAEGLDNAYVKQVIFDGNRYRIGAGTHGPGENALVMMGVARGQKIQNCVFMSTRSWSSLKLHEGEDCGNNVVEQNVFLGSGVGARGNGRHESEGLLKGRWGDAVSLGCRETVVRNNLIIDPTNAGVAIYGAPGSVIEQNLVVSMSREALCAFSMVDTLGIYSNGKGQYRYTGTTVRNNIIDAFGSRIHIGIPLGRPVWVPNTRNIVLTGGTVTGNRLTGGAFGYGICVNSVDSFSVLSNSSDAVHRGVGDGLPGQPDPDPPDHPFLYEFSQTGSSSLQPEFRPSVRPLEHLLRSNDGPYVDGVKGNFVADQYTDEEIQAIVQAAYIEMLGRRPRPAENDRWLDWLMELSGGDRNENTADMLRMELMGTTEFKQLFGTVVPKLSSMQLHRTDRWMAVLAQLVDAGMADSGSWPEAVNLYGDAMALMSVDPALEIIQPMNARQSVDIVTEIQDLKLYDLLGRKAGEGYFNGNHTDRRILTGNQTLFIKP